MDYAQHTPHAMTPKRANNRKTSTDPDNYNDIADGSNDDLGP